MGDSGTLLCDSLHFAHRTRVACKFAVVGDQCDSLNHRLGQQNTIKRILVCMRQLVRVDGMFTSDWEFGVAIIQQARPLSSRLREKAQETHDEVGSAESALKTAASYT